MDDRKGPPEGRRVTLGRLRGVTDPSGPSSITVSDADRLRRASAAGVLETLDGNPAGGRQNADQVRQFLDLLFLDGTPEHVSDIVGAIVMSRSFQIDRINAFLEANISPRLRENEASINTVEQRNGISRDPLVVASYGKMGAPLLARLLIRDEVPRGLHSVRNRPDKRTAVAINAFFMSILQLPAKVRDTFIGDMSALAASMQLDAQFNYTGQQGVSSEHPLRDRLHISHGLQRRIHAKVRLIYRITKLLNKLAEFKDEEGFENYRINAGNIFLEDALLIQHDFDAAAIRRQEYADICERFIASKLGGVAPLVHLIQDDRFQQYLLLTERSMREMFLILKVCVDALCAGSVDKRMSLHRPYEEIVRMQDVFRELGM